MITSTSSSQVKHVVQLQKKARARKEFKEFVVEGLRIVSEVPQDRLVKVYASETFAATNEQFLSQYNDKLEITSDNVFMQMSDTKTPQGVLAVVNIKEAAVKDMLNNNPLLIIVENLQDPGNLGTIIRMGEGAGISGIIMNRNTVDIYNPLWVQYSECHLCMQMILNRFFASARKRVLLYMRLILTEKICMTVIIADLQHFL